MTEPVEKGYWIDVESMRVAGNVDAKGETRARSHCRFVRPLIRFTPDSRTYSVPLFLKRTPGKPTWMPQHCLPGNCVSCDADAGVSPALIEQHEADPTTLTGVGPQTFVESLGRGGATRARSHCRFARPLSHFTLDSLR